MRYFGRGGLSAATSDEEDPLDAALQTQDEIVDEAKSGGLGEVTDSYGAKARRISKMTRDSALDRLRQGRQAILDQKRDQKMKHFRMAQAFLSPSRTGQFGENLGKAAGVMAEDMESQSKFDIDRTERLQQLEEEMEGVERGYAEREIDILGEEEDAASSNALKLRGQPFDTYVEDPDDPSKKIKVKGMMRADGSWYVPRDAKGNVAILPDTLDPLTNYLKAQAKEAGKVDVKTLDTRVKTVALEKDRLAKSYYGLTILDSLDAEGNQTGGLQGYIQKFREFFGSSAKDVVDRGTLMNVMGQQLFESLAAFGTQINAKELAVAEQLSGGIGRPSGINRQMLQDLIQKLENTVRVTTDLTNDYGTDLQKALISSPMIDYGIGDNLQERAKRVGFTLEKHIPFKSAPAGPDAVEVKTFPAGELGHAQTPFEPVDMEEAAVIIQDPANKGGFVRDPRSGKLKKI